MLRKKRICSSTFAYKFLIRIKKLLKYSFLFMKTLGSGQHKDGTDRSGPACHAQQCVAAEMLLQTMMRSNTVCMACLNRTQKQPKVSA